MNAYLTLPHSYRPARRAATSGQTCPQSDAEWNVWLTALVSRFPARFRDDLMQTGRVTLWKARRDFDADNQSGASLKTYIHLRVVGSLKNWLRDNASTIHVPQAAYQSGVRTACLTGLDTPEWETVTAAASGKPSRMESDVITNVQIRSALSALPQTERDLIKLVAVEGRSFREVAQITGKSRSYVHETYHRAAGQMRELLADTDGMAGGL